MKSIRCCCPRGRLFIQDIIGYGDPAIDAYVEELEIAIDSSHARTLLRDEFTDLYTEAGLRGIHGAEFRIRLDFVNYVGHAVQSEEMQAEIDKLIEMGLGTQNSQAFSSCRTDASICCEMCCFSADGRTRRSQSAGGGRAAAEDSASQT